jgi:Zn-dependent protease with chaperone function
MTAHSFEAHCYAPQSSYSESLTVLLTNQGQLQFIFQDQQVVEFFDNLTISARLGNTPRLLDLPNGLRLETDANELIDQFLKRQTGAEPTFYLHRMEKSLRWVMVLLVVVAFSAFGLYQYGIPLFSRMASPFVPDTVRSIASQQTLMQMDEFLLDETTLFSWEQNHYRQLFAETLQPIVGQDIDLQFRNSAAMGANAFALPDGTVVFTDQLIELINDDEFLAIAAHEAGHVDGDHGMRSVISSTSLLLAITLITGDSEAISELLVTAPTLLMQMSYSRDLEAEADNAAIECMQMAGIDLEAFATGMEKILHEHDMTEDNNDWLTYFSTHPDPHERIAKFRALQNE